MVIPQCALVRAAIGHVKQQQRGASLVQIRKHLEATYEEKLDAKKKKLIRSTFKTLIQEGKLLQRGTLYKSTKHRSVALADVPQRHHRRRHHRRRHHKRRHHRKRHHRRRHHKRRHHKRRRHGRRHHRSRHHRRHRRRHHEIKVKPSNRRTYTHIHHGGDVSGNFPSVEVPMDQLAPSHGSSKAD